MLKFARHCLRASSSLVLAWRVMGLLVCGYHPQLAKFLHPFRSQRLDPIVEWMGSEGVVMHWCFMKRCTPGTIVMSYTHELSWHAMPRKNTAVWFQHTHHRLLSLWKLFCDSFVPDNHAYMQIVLRSLLQSSYYRIWVLKSLTIQQYTSLLLYHESLIPGDNTSGTQGLFSPVDESSLLLCGDIAKARPIQPFTDMSKCCK